MSALPSNPQDDKADLRQRMRHAMETLPADQTRSKAAALAERALAWQPLARARRVMVYLSMSGEAGTGELIARLLEAEVEVAAPRIDWDTRTISPAQIRDPLADVVEGRLSVPEPAPHAPGLEIGSIDVVLVPGLAFDLRGFRLGRGAGFYDRFLADKRRRGLSLGYGFEAQIAGRVPTEPHDARLDALVTERRLLEINGPRIAEVLEAETRSQGG
ncbi:MAG: 5-formyltetrahydrofolate cyclo-ligase [Phycisphaerales bacterium]